MAIIQIVRDLKHGCKYIPLRLGVVFVSLCVALGVNVGMKWTSHSFFEGTATPLIAEIKAHLGKPGIGIGSG